jgi:Glycosyltransferase family 92
MMHRLLLLLIFVTCSHACVFSEWREYILEEELNFNQMSIRDIECTKDKKKKKSASKSNPINNCVLAVCALFYNEAEYLKEWIEFHKIVGVERFYLFNHSSTDHYLAILLPYIKNGEVVMYDWHFDFKPGDILTFDTKQKQAYNLALSASRNQVKWLAFIDIDEFLFPVEGNSLPKLLKEYEAYPGLTVNWQMFGTSGVKKIPQNKLLIETLVYQSPKDFWWNVRIKSIVRPIYAIEAINPHFFSYHNQQTAVNSDNIAFHNDCSPYVVVNKVRINHYYTRDEDHFFNEKVPRRIKWYGKYDYETWYDDLNSEYNSEILRFIPILRKKMGLDKY